MKIHTFEIPFMIRCVREARDIPVIAALFRDYAAGLGVDLAYQGFDAELASLPGKYQPPRGELLLAETAAGAPIGCVGLRGLDAPGVCEMKRLFVCASARGLGLGRRLALRLIEIARERGYREIRLDTLASMAAAQALYRELGFLPIAPYFDSPVDGNQFFSKVLS